jgi:hypothetical protein
MNLNPSGAGSLSAVLGAAAPGDTIVFASGLSGTVTPSATLTVANSVTIQGPGAGVITVSGGGARQVFVINGGVSATISGLTITGGLVSSSTADAQGGAIDNEGNLALLNDVISNSTASATGASHSARGGGIFSNGTLSLVNCTVSGNTAQISSGVMAQGGGIDSEGPVLSVSGCTITGNTATSASNAASGGGIEDHSSTDSIVNTTFTTNTASVTIGNGTAVGGGITSSPGMSGTGSNITTFTNLTFSGNTASCVGTGDARGGGFLYFGALGTFTNVNVTGNTASSSGTGTVQGGGAFLVESVNWTGGLVSGNTATSSGSATVEGGGIICSGIAPTHTTFTNLTISGNTGSNTGSGNVEGGGIFTEEFLALSTSTVSGNKATANSGTAQGGGIWNSDNLAVTNATLFGNSVTATAGTAQGGGIWNSNTTTLINDTLASNTATGATAQGGGIFNSSTLNLANTIDFNPSGAATDPDFSGTITATQNSLFGSDVTGQIAANANLGGNQFSTNPMLGPLASNGGPTQTLALLPGSPAIGAGVNISPLGGIPTTDQRGMPRPGPAGFDIGAFQTQPPPATGANSARFPLGFGPGTGGVQAIVNLQANGQTVALANPFPRFAGEVRRATGDFNGDGVSDIVWAAGPGGGPEVKVIDGATGAVLADFFAFAPGFSGGVFVAVGDVNGDGRLDIIVGAGAGGGPEVKVIDGTKLTQTQANGEIASSALLADFYAFAPSFTGGVTVAAGDVNADGKADVVVGAGSGGGPAVEVIDGTKLNQVQANGQIAPSALLASFFAFAPSFTGGVFVAAGDVNGDGRADVVVGAGSGGGPAVLVIDGTKLGQVQADGQIAPTALLGSFFAFSPSFTGGVRVDAVDVNGDGRADVVVGAGPGGGPAVLVIDATKLGQVQADGEIAPAALLDAFFATSPGFPGGVFV